LHGTLVGHALAKQRVCAPDGGLAAGAFELAAAWSVSLFGLLGTSHPGLQGDLVRAGAAARCGAGKQ